MLRENVQVKQFNASRREMEKERAMLAAEPQDSKCPATHTGLWEIGPQPTEQSKKPNGPQVGLWLGFLAQGPERTATWPALPGRLLWAGLRTLLSTGA